MRRIVISGLAALAAVLGGVAVPAAAMAQPTLAVRPAAALPGASAVAMRPARAAEEVDGVSGEPLISCVLTADCVGIEGSSSLSDGAESSPTRVARWNGSSWKGVRVTLPKGTRSDDLAGISCKGAKSCLVVGDYYTSTSKNAANHVLALAYNGTALKPTSAVPLPKGTTDAALTSVSCTTTTHCVAVGVADGDTSAFGQTGSLNIIETWNGAKWALGRSAAEAAGPALQVEPTVISCPTSAFCVLAGDTYVFTSDAVAAKLYVASWNGKKITAMKPAAVNGGTGYLDTSGVSCASASNCAVTGAVLGDITSKNPSSTAFSEVWNGKTWQLPKVTWPKGSADSFTTDVSCYAAHSCEAVGEDGANDSATSPFAAVAVSFNGTAGRLQAVPAPSKGYSNAFAGVSCLPWGSCVAIGQTGKTTTTSPALMTGVWSGKAWKLDPGF